MDTKIIGLLIKIGFEKLNNAIYFDYQYSYKRFSFTKKDNCYRLTERMTDRIFESYNIDSMITYLNKTFVVELRKIKIDNLLNG